MSDNPTAADAATNNPAEAVQVEESTDVKPDAKVEATSEVTKGDATDYVKSGDKDATNGSAEEDKIESSAEKSEEKDTNGAVENGEKSRDGRGYRSNRGGKYNGSSRFDKNRKPRCANFRPSYAH